MALATAFVAIGAMLSPGLPVQDASLGLPLRVVAVVPTAERPGLTHLTVAETGDPVPSLHVVTMRRSNSTRPAPLMPLYTSLAVLQSLDLYTTSAAVSRGANEANPAMRPFAGKTVGALAVKAAAYASTIYFTERAWKRNRKGAVVLMTAINVASAAIVAHNTRVAKRD